MDGNFLLTTELLPSQLFCLNPIAPSILVSLRDCDICQQFVPRPKLFVKRVITFVSASKNFQLKKTDFRFFLKLSFFFFRFPAYGRDTACHDLYQFGLT